MDGPSSSGSGRPSQEDVVLLSDSSSDAPPRRKRGRRGATEDPDFEAPSSSAGPKRRRTPKKGTGGAKATTGKPKSRSSEEDVAAGELPTGWSALPHPVLLKTFSLMANEDVISAGQCGSRLWRAAAKDRSVWRGRRLSYDLPAARNPRGDWHAGARQFARTIRFAPCLEHVSCAKSLRPAAKKAIATQSACEVRSAELNGQLKWTAKYILRQKDTLRDLTLLNPTVDALQTALALPRLSGLAVSYERDETQEKYQSRRSRGASPQPYCVPAVPKNTKGTLQKLVCHPGVGPAAVESLVLANAATLEEVGAHCFPVAALRQCPRLQRLMVKVDPAADEGQLRELLEGKALEYLAFIGTRGHAQAPCAALRASLRDAKAVRLAVVCSPCDKACARALDRPRFTSRDEPGPQYGGHGGGFNFLASMFRLSGPCRCFACVNVEVYYANLGEGSEDGEDYY